MVKSERWGGDRSKRTSPAQNFSKLIARLLTRDRSEASSILTTFLETSPASSLAFEKGVGVGPVTPSGSSLFFALTRYVLNHLIRKLIIIKRNMLNRLGGMTKKQFVAMADSIREHNQLAKFNGENAFTVDQLAALARFCASENPRFKRERWLDYIAGRCGPNGGTVAA
jgi:hypothetical protein